MKKNVNIWLTLSILLLAVFSATILPAEQEYAGKSPAKPQNPQSEIGEGGNRRLGNACLRANRTGRQGAPNKSVLTL
ncbi:MAG: hypothetical protein Q7J76_04170 [Candidatus Brocadiaceae bacterium]|nr:hypothetical protein [Candidatus Brocadiaceae bacterium]